MTRSERAHTQFLLYRETGSPEALAEVFDLCAQELLLLAHHIAAPGVAAEDLVQTTFLVAIRSAGRFKPDRRVMPWLCGILTNTARSQNRSSRRLPDVHRMSFGATENPQDYARAQEFTAAVTEAIADLPDRQREVLTLRLIHGLTPTEIAHALGEPVGTVKSWVHRGILRLKSRLPAGLAAAVLAMIGSPPGLVEVKAAVLAAAGGAVKTVPAASAVGAAGASARGVAGSTVALAGSVAALAVLLTAWALVGGSDLPDPLGAGASPAAAAAVSGSEFAGPTSDESLRTRRDLVGADEPSSGVLVDARHADGAPASISLRLQPLFGNDPVFRETEFETDVHGRARLLGVDPGPYQLAVDRAPPRRIEVGEGIVSVELVLDRGWTVAGRVVGADDQPVAGARVWLSAWGDLARGTLLAPSDPQGRFELRDLHQDQAIAIVAEGYPPSPLHWVREVGAPEGPPAPWVVTLDEPCAPVTLRVVDELGAPCAEARVQFGAGTEWSNGSVSGMHELYPPLWYTTDRNGSVTHLSPVSRTERVWIRAVGKAVYRGTLTVAAARDIVLARGASWSGSVGGIAGGRAWVEATRMEDRRCSSSDVPPSFVAPRAHVGDDGRFWLDGLAAAALTLRAASEATGVEVTRDVSLTTDPHHEWSPSLQSNQPLVGWALDVTGRPLVDYRVAVFDDADQLVAGVVGADGRFVVEGLLGAPKVAWLAGPEGSYPATLAHRALPVQDGRELVLRLAEARRPSASLRVRVRDGDLKPIEALRLASQSDGALVTGRAQGDGWVEFGPLPPGDFHVTVPGTQGTRFIHGPISLARDETREIDDLSVQPPGRLRARVDGAGAADTGPLEAALMTLDGSYMVSYFVLRDGVGETGEVPPGRYECRLHDGIGADSVVVDVEAAAIQEVVFRLAPVRGITITVSHPELAPGLLLHRRLTRDDQDRSLLAVHPVLESFAGETALPLSLRPGNYEIEVWTNEGCQGEARFHLSDEGLVPVVRIDLR